MNSHSNTRMVNNIIFQIGESRVKVLISWQMKNINLSPPTSLQSINLNSRIINSHTSMINKTVCSKRMLTHRGRRCSSEAISSNTNNSSFKPSRWNNLCWLSSKHGSTEWINSRTSKRLDKPWALMLTLILFSILEAKLQVSRRVVRCLLNVTMKMEFKKVGKTILFSKV